MRAARSARRAKRGTWPRGGDGQAGSCVEFCLGGVEVVGRVWGEGAHLCASKDELKRRHGARVARTHVGVAVLVEHHAAAVGEQNVVSRRLAVLDRLAHHDACAGWGGQ